jgi:PhnB protein
MHVQPYLFFEGRCQEAMGFYVKALGAEVAVLLPFKDSPDPPPPGMRPPGAEHKVMHACLRIGDTNVMMSDGRCEGGLAFQGFSLSITLADAARAGEMFRALADGGQVQMPLGRTFWSPQFGMVADRFGVGWMINVQPTVGVTTFVTPSDREFVAARVFEAPRQLVWDAHVSPKHVSQWMLGPDGWTMPVCEIDLRSGGRWHFGWRDVAGSPMEMRGEYREIAAPARLVHTEAWGDGWAETLNTTVLAEQDCRTVLTCTVLYPSKEARDRALGTGMKEGWSQSYDRLDMYLRGQ